MRAFGLLTLASAAPMADAGDPSEGWCAPASPRSRTPLPCHPPDDPSRAARLSYAVFKAQPTQTITRMSATMTVPDAPKERGSFPAFWFGTQTAKGDGALVQPIMAKWLGDSFYMFQEIFDWTAGK